MAHLTIELPKTLSQKIEAMGLSRHQLNEVVAHLLQVYLSTPHVSENFLGYSNSYLNKPARKAGSAKHLNIKMADDFDAPLDDFAEYMS